MARAPSGSVAVTAGVASGGLHLARRVRTPALARLSRQQWASHGEGNRGRAEPGWEPSVRRRCGQRQGSLRPGTLPPPLGLRRSPTPPRGLPPAAWAQVSHWKGISHRDLKQL